MQYVPIVKTRQEELRVIRNLNHCFDKDIIPLFEILNEFYYPRYKMDPETGKPLYEVKKGNANKTRIKEEKTQDDIITLQKLNMDINGKRAFVDYFRFNPALYGSFDPKKVELALKLNNNYNLYRSKIEGITEYRNFIPVISMKPSTGLTIRNSDLIDFITSLQKNASSVALRLTDDLFDVYKDIIENCLRPSDFLLYDIGEQKVSSKIMELSEFASSSFNFETILLNSPRLLKRNNGEYERSGFTKFIDNSARLEYKKYGFSGFGDYGGLKDSLSTGASNNKGCALALIYMNKQNQFLSFMNPDSSLGSIGYNLVKGEILKLTNFIDPKNECPAMDRIRSIPTTGSWSTWHYIELIISLIYYLEKAG